MQRDRRFFAGLVGVTAVVTWLIWTGVSETMVYYLTPTELLARAEGDPSVMERGVRVSGNVVPGSRVSSSEELLHTFEVSDPADPEVVITVQFRLPLPDTFTDEVEVVMEGRYLGNGLFEATEVLTKCGSRYEAMPEEGSAGNGGYGGYGGYGESGTEVAPGADAPYAPSVAPSSGAAADA
jgi:cytochrome c-type biogenesis protein CcmE